ncbi:MAG: hypothetical protein WCT05_00145 [Lentisphaeria bacterium]
MLILPGIKYFCCFLVLLVVFSQPLRGAAEGKKYHSAELSERERAEIGAWGSYARARFLINDRSLDVDRIADHLRDCLIVLPEAESPLRLLLLLQRSKSDPSKLLTNLSAVASANPENARINIVYAECLVDHQQSEAACLHLLAFIRRTGWKHAEAVMRLLQIKASLGAWDEASAFLKKALRHKALRNDPKMQVFEALFLLEKAEACSGEERVQLQEKSRKRAQFLIQPLLNDPETLHDWELFSSLFPVLSKLENWQELNRLLDLAPKDFQQSEFCFSHKLLALQKLGDVKGLHEFSRKIFSDPGLTEPAIEQIALTNIELGELARAADIYELLHLRNSQSLHYRMQLAWLYLSQRFPVKGLAMLAPVKQLPFHGLLLKAALLKAHQEAEKALAVYQQAETLALSSGQQEELNTFFYTSYALAAETAGQLKVAITQFRKAHKLDPDSPEICNGLGYTLADHLQDLTFAEELIEKAVKAEPENVAYLDSLAWVRFRLQKYHEALKAILKTLTLLQPGLDPDGVIHQHASEIFAVCDYPDLADLFHRKAEWVILQEKN